MVPKSLLSLNSFFPGITTVLTLSTISLESRTDLPKVHYATALDWFIICSFAYCIATLLEFAGVHYFTKVSHYSALMTQSLGIYSNVGWQWRGLQRQRRPQRGRRQRRRKG